MVDVATPVPLAPQLAELWAAVQAEVPPGSAREATAAEDFFHSALSLSVEMWFEKGDPLAPEFTEWEHPGRRFAGDGPGTVSASAPVDPDHRYRITGFVPDARYVGLQVYTRGPGEHALAANAGHAALGLTAGGSFTVVVGGDPPADGGPWLPLGPRDFLLMVRVCRRDPFGPSEMLRIERIGGARRAGDAPGAAVAAFFREAVLSTIGVTESLRAAGSNSFPTPDAPLRRPRYTGARFPTRDNVYDGCWVDLGPGEVLKVRGMLPRARYSSFVFSDRWSCTPDYRRVRCFRTSDDLVVEDNGTYTMHVGPIDTGHPNWIDTDGLTQGIFASRCLLPEERTLPTLTVGRLR